MNTSPSPPPPLIDLSPPLPKICWYHRKLVIIFHFPISVIPRGISSDSSNATIIVVVCVTILTLLIIFAISWWFCRRRKNTQQKQSSRAVQVVNISK